jgi:RNA polymerase sigma-70 factor (ECF subfamily)
MSVDEEAKLVEAAGKGDEEAFARLFERYTGPLAGRVRRVVPLEIMRKVSSADILQEVRITAFQRIAGFAAEGEGAFRRWLMRILEHKIGDVLRRYRTRKRAVGAEITRGRRPETRNVHGPQGTPSQAAILAESKRLVRASLAQLPSDYRTILRLVFEEQLSLREAAQRIGRSHEAGKKLYSRALARLTELHKRACGGSEDG